PQPTSTEGNTPPSADTAKQETAVDSPVSSTPPVAPRSDASERERPRVKITLVEQTALSVAPLVDAFTLPGVAPGLRARVARDFLVFGFALQGVLLPSLDRKLEGVNLSTGYAAGGLRIFRPFRLPDWEFDASVGLSLGQYWVEGVGADVRR